MDNLKMQEYDYLRSEVMQKMNLHNSLLTFTITTTVAALSFAVSERLPLLCLIPFCIIIPMSSRIAYYRYAMVKISAYMIVFLEPVLKEMQWETRNVKMIRYLSEQRKKKRLPFTALKYNECLIIGIVCYFCYLYLGNFFPLKQVTPRLAAEILWPIALLIIEGCITVKSNRVDKEREVWIERWKTIKKEQLKTAKKQRIKDKHKK